MLLKIQKTLRHSRYLKIFNWICVLMLLMKVFGIWRKVEYNGEEYFIFINNSKEERKILKSPQKKMKSSSEGPPLFFYHPQKLWVRRYFLAGGKVSSERKISRGGCFSLIINTSLATFFSMQSWIIGSSTSFQISSLPHSPWVSPPWVQCLDVPSVHPSRYPSCLVHLPLEEPWELRAPPLPLPSGQTQIAAVWPRDPHAGHASAPVSLQCQSHVHLYSFVLGPNPAVYRLQFVQRRCCGIMKKIDGFLSALFR